MKTKLLNVFIIICALLINSSLVNGKNYVELRNDTYTETFSPLDLTTASIPYVTSISGPTDGVWMRIMECYSAYTSGPVPSNCYFVWMVTPSENVEIRDSNTSNFCVSFQAKGTYMIHCRTQSTSGEVTLNRYIQVNVTN